MTRPPLLFLSGAGLPAFVWDEVRARLDTESRVVASPGPEGTLASYAAAAVRTAEGWPAFHVVAHSLGGTVAAAVVAAEPTRVTRVTGVAAVVPSPGSSYVGALPFPARLAAGVLVRTVGTRPPASVLRAMCAGLSEEDTERVVAGFSPEGRRVYLDRTPPRSWPPASYVVTTHDREFQPQVQERYAAELGAPTHTLRTGHLPMLERPDELAALLDQAS